MIDIIHYSFISCAFGARRFPIWFDINGEQAHRVFDRYIYRDQRK
jgi:hypothetical protein